jgi:dihydrodipicolinate synthase/N-acetylneuraminate lyase
MPSSCYPDVLTLVWSHYWDSDRDGAIALHSRYLPLLDFELHCGGRQVIKEVLRRRGWIDRPAVRSPRGAAWDADAMNYLDTLYTQFADELATFTNGDTGGGR